MADAKLTALTETSVPALADLVYSVDVDDTTDDAAGSSRKLTLSRLLGLLLPCQGRLTTESGVPVSTSDRTAQGTIYFTPYQGSRVALYDGTRWRLYAFSEISLALSSLTSGKNYDVFVYDNSGTLTLELSAAWTNDTTRADALTAQDGVQVKSGATTRRHVGTIRTTGTTTTEDSATKRFVWNYYNQRPRYFRRYTGTSYEYDTNTWRQCDASSTHQVEYVTGDAATEVTITIAAQMVCFSTGNYASHYKGIGVDSTTVLSSHESRRNNQSGNNVAADVNATYQGQPGLGYHYLAGIERGDGGGGSLATYTVDFNGGLLA